MNRYGNGLGPPPTLAYEGTLDLSGRSYVAMSGKTVHGSAEQKVVVVHQGSRYHAHCWNHIGFGSSVDEALANLDRVLDEATERADLIGGTLVGVA